MASSAEPASSEEDCGTWPSERIVTIWQPVHGRRNATAHTLRILDAIERDMLRYGAPRPQVSLIRIGADLNDGYDFEVDLQLAPGCIAAVRYQAVDDEVRDPVEDECGAVAFLVKTVIEDLFRVGGGAEALAQRLHDLRVETRKELAAWARSGTNVMLVEMYFAFTDFECPPWEVPIKARFTTLDNHLRPTFTTFEVGQIDAFLTNLATWRPRLDAPLVMQAALAQQGADGLVDRLVLNAVAQYEDADIAWRTIAAGHAHLFFEYQLTVFTTNGHVQCGGHSSDGKLTWNLNRVTLNGRTLPVAAAEALRGRPITALVEHPILSDDMIITRVWSESDWAGHRVIVEFDQPLLLFCSASGRVWAPEEESLDRLRVMARPARREGGELT